MKRLPLLVLLVLLPACDRGPGETPPEVQAERRQAARQACIAHELVRRAQDQFQTLQASLPQGDAGADAGWTAGRAATEYARAYLQHAELRAAAYAQVDSAVNASRRQADSLRHAQAAERFAIRMPEAGTLEANVLQAYERDFVEIRSDADHPCNWDLEDSEETVSR